jgi:polyisoprenyl-teichoic acid--peptidoglycan teichoic acid transferase
MDKQINGIKIHTEESLPGREETKKIEAHSTAKSSQVDFLRDYRQDSKISQPNKWRRRIKILSLVSILFVFLAGSLLFSNYLLANQTTESFSASLSKINLWEQLANLMGISEEAEQPRDRLNFLLMGMGGSGHEGPFLTDTIILASIKPSTMQTSLISIPRDLAVKYSATYYPKVNELYTIGWKNDLKEPGAFTANIIAENFGIFIDYYAVVDFNGLVEIVDLLDGLTLDVAIPFTDHQYPTTDFEFQTIEFTAGLQTMDGEQALKYTRSRHGDNGEGSDFARSKRQQKVLFALKDKLMNYYTFFNPYKITKLYNLFSKYIETNVGIKDAVSLYDLFAEVDRSNTIQVTLDDAPSGLLVSDITEEGAYILKPKGGFVTLQEMINNIFDTNETKAENAIIQVQNGSTTAGLAYTVTQQLRQYGVRVEGFKNATTQDYQRTIIYDFSNGTKTLTSDLLQDILKDAIITTNIPNHLIFPEGEEQLDFIIILGQDIDYHNNLDLIYD